MTAHLPPNQPQPEPWDTDKGAAMDTLIGFRNGLAGAVMLWAAIVAFGVLAWITVHAGG